MSSDSHDGDSTTGSIRTEAIGEVWVVTIDRPAKRNALNFAMRQGLREAFDAFESDPTLRCAILTATGSVFCAGADLAEMAASGMAVPGDEINTLLSSRGKVSKPVIAAVNGAAMAGGFRLAQDCDLCILGESATIGITEVKRGRGAPWAAPLISMVPQRIMLELLLTGDMMTAQRAYEIGFANRVVPDDDVLQTALTMAQGIAANAPLSVLAAKAMVELSTEVGTTLAVRGADTIYEHVYLSDDAKEGPRAFAEKRPPVWTGR